jgi:hypothetical protein
MTFTQFEQIFKSKYPDGTVCSHGTVENDIQVTVSFKPYGKIYRYNKSYGVILRDLGFKVVYQHDLIDCEKRLEYIKEQPLKKVRFGKFIVNTDYSEEIKELEQKIADYKQNYIIIK